MDQEKKPQDEQPVTQTEGQETDPGVVVEPEAEVKPQPEETLGEQPAEQPAAPGSDDVATSSESGTTTEPATQPPTPPTAPTAPVVSDAGAVTTAEPRNFLVAFLMVLSFGYFGLHQVYLGHKTQGWIRFALGVLSYPLMFLLIGFLIVPVLAIWAVVDFFMLYLGKRVDAEGQPLTATGRDASWAKVIFIISLVVWGLYLAGIVLAVVFGVVSGLQDSVNQPGFQSNYDYYDSSY